MRRAGFVAAALVGLCAFGVSADPPDMAAELNKRGVGLMRSGMREEAEKVFKEVLAIDPDNAAAHNNIGFCYQERGEIEMAIGEYRKALALSSDPVVTRHI